MKALKIVGLVFGILILLTGGGLLAGSAALGSGADAGNKIFTETLAKQGFEGPVTGKVTDTGDVANTYEVTFTDKSGKEQTSESALMADTTKTVAVGDEVSIYYQTSDPEVAVIIGADMLGGAVKGVSGGLRTGGFVTLGVGGLLTVGCIAALLLGRKNTGAAALTQASFGVPGQAPQGYAPQGYPQPGQPPHGQPPHGQPPHGQPPHGQAPHGYPQPGPNPYQGDAQPPQQTPPAGDYPPQS